MTKNNDFIQLMTLEDFYKSMLIERKKNKTYNGIKKEGDKYVVVTYDPVTRRTFKGKTKYNTVSEAINERVKYITQEQYEMLNSVKINEIVPTDLINNNIEIELIPLQKLKNI